MSSPTPPRKFLVEPPETSSRSNRKSTPDPIDTISTVPRKFAPEPIETTTRSSRDSGEGKIEEPQKRRILPQPIHTSRSSNRPSQSEKSVPRKFLPQLMETSTSRRKQDDVVVEVAEKEQHKNASPIVESFPPRRKFTPLLIDTAKRIRRVGDTRPAHAPSDRTDAIPGDARVRKVESPPLPIPPENTPISTGIQSPAITSAEARRLGMAMPRRLISQLSQNSLRQHSYSVPSLEPIDSSESGEELDESSFSSSHSSSSDAPYMYMHATRTRESIDATSSGYLLELAAKAAERQLRDQALAAFPNDETHVRINHYIGRDSDHTTAASSRSEFDHRRFGSMNWELKDMRRHHEKLEAGKEREQARRKARREWNKKQEDEGPWRNPFKNFGSKKKDAEMPCMLRQARPPMLGGDIEFPRCPSPEPARFDVTQGSYVERTAMCYLTIEQTSGSSSSCQDGLWAVKEKKGTDCSLWSQAPSRVPSSSGLWGGFCHGSSGGLSPPRGPSGLLTPHVLDESMMDPFDSLPSSLSRQFPPSPPASNSGVASVADKLELEQSIEAEFSDEFVTQVYNYLSLGYPSLARRYDSELGKIARVPISDLRHDDEIETARGYIRLGENENGKEEGIEGEMCARWKALRAYIHEWARQQPRMCEPVNRHGGFGVAVRRGSWLL